MLITIVKKLLGDIASVILPFECHICKSDTDFGIVLCQNCHNNLIKSIHPPKIINDTKCDFHIYTVSSYTSMISELIKVIKYRPSKKLLKIFSDTCSEQADFRTFLNKTDVLIPVPMHSKRLSQRGFNQAEYMARSIAKASNCQYSHAIIRTRATRAQADCNEKERRFNLDNAFSLTPDLKQSWFENRRLILIDDVATTGTTLMKCSEPLKSLKPLAICAIVASHSYKQIK